jgi:hypothetical protein
MLRRLFAIAAALIVLFLLWANHRERKQAPSLREVEWPNLKDSWLDVRLPVEEVKKISPGHFRVVTQGLNNGQTLGLTFDFKNIDPNRDFLQNLGKPNAGEVKATPGGVVLTSQGEPTANFVRTYAALAHRSLSGLTVPSTLNLNAINLEGDPQSIPEEAGKIKVFHADDDSDGPYYFEAFINADVPKGYIELSEKDPEYRDGLLRSFGAKF